MKYESVCPYLFHEHFESPLRDFLENEQNKEIVDKIIDKWITPNFLCHRTKNPKEYFFETMTIAQVWLPYDHKKDWIYVSWIYLIIREIIDNFLASLPRVINTEPIIKLLNGVMYHKYFSTGKYAEKLFEYMEECMDDTIVIKKGINNPQIQIGRRIINIRNQIIPCYLEDISIDSDFDSEEIVGEILRKIKKNQELSSLSNRELNAIHDVRWKEKNLLKISKKGIDFAKKAGLPEEVIKGLRQVRIERGTKFTLTLLIAIITNIYFKKELLLYYNPFMYEMGICDKNSFILDRPDVYLVVDFGKIINKVFCEHCIAKIIWKTKINFNKNVENKEAIKAIFDDLFDLISKTHPDDLKINIEGKVNDTSRYSEINDLVPFWKVWHNKYNGKKECIVFSVKKDLKKYKKSLI